jgi:hypothetical protein
MKVAIFGFPSGTAAYESDRKFHDEFKKQGTPPYGWLAEHMLYPFPDHTLFDGLPPEWSVECFGNERIGFHEWVNRREMSRIAKGIFWDLLTVAPRPVEVLLRRPDRAPFYRLIVVVTRKPQPGGDASC